MTITRILLAGLLAIAPAACSKSQSRSSHDQTPAAGTGKATEPAATTGAATAAASDALAAIMTPYEKCRALLAADQTDGVGECAAAMHDAASSAEATAPVEARANLAAISAAAALLAGAAPELEGARLAFGDVSRAVIAALTAAPETAAGYHVFECPMAKGFNRWAQSDAALANPYMGTKMLTCGTEVHDHHAGMAMPGGAHAH